MKKTISKIFLIFTILLTITVVVFVFLSSIERKGYLEVIDVYNVETYENNVYKYKIKMNYYDKIFRHSDIFSVHPITNNLPDYIEMIKFDSSGSPFGNITTSKELKVDEKIDNFYYTVKIKINIFIYLLAIYLICLLLQFPNIIYLVSKLDTNKKLFKVACVLILVFALFIRIYYALQDEAYYHDEYASIWFSNVAISYWHPESFTFTLINEELEYDRVYSGKEIKQKYYYNDASVKDALNDIVSLYKNTNDPQISNVYYTLLRLAFIGREASSITNIILTGTILNSIFYIISFYFLIKLLKLLFKNNNFIILFTLLCISLLPSSISFTMFLRPYQMQESFFIVFIYLVLNTILNKKYSIKNFIIIAIITGIGYLILTSSIVFVLCVSLVIFFYYLYDNYNYFKSIKNSKDKIKLIYQRTMEDKSLIYFAPAFFLAFLVSFIIYPNFFNMLTQNTGRIGYIEILNVSVLFTYLNIYLFITPANIVIFALAIATNIKFTKIKKYLPQLFIIISAILFYIMAAMTAPHWPLPRYAIAVHPLLFLVIPTLLLYVDNKKIKIMFIIIISTIYIINSFTTKNIMHMYKKPSDDILIFNKQPDIDVYGIDNLLSKRDTPYFNKDQKYILVKDYDSLKNNLLKDNVSNFYLITKALNKNEVDKYLTIENELTNYNIIEDKLYQSYTITELEKKE